MSSAGSWSWPAPKSMTLNQPWNCPRKRDHKKSQRQVMPLGVGHWDQGPMVAMSRAPFGFFRYQLTSTGGISEPLCGTHRLSRGSVRPCLQPCSLSQATGACLKSSGLAIIQNSESCRFWKEHAVYYVTSPRGLGQCPEIKHISILQRQVNIQTELHEFKAVFHF